MRKERENRRKRLTIGIDVGGTNTDGVLYDTEERRIISSEKIPTNHADYRVSIEAALGRLLRTADSEEIISLNISTTLSTNALLEGKGAPVALVLMRYCGPSRRRRCSPSAAAITAGARSASRLTARR